MEKIYSPDVPVGEIVAADVRTAVVFTNAGIDFCCGGKKSLAQSCEEVGKPVESLVNELVAITREPIDYARNYREWEPGFLCDYIVNTHHRFVAAKLPELLFYTGKIASVHGERHPELMEVAELFRQIDAELRQHLMQEEKTLFPAIKRMSLNPSVDDKSIIRSEISRMLGEHDFAGGAMDKINRITGNYLVPEDGCNTYRVALAGLKAFEEDLHLHVHLENNILFLKASHL